MFVIFDQCDDKIDVKQGYWFYGSVMLFFGLQDEIGSGVQVILEGWKYYSFGVDDKFMLVGCVCLGMVIGFDIDQVLCDYLFYFGGGGMVCGYFYELLGVEVIFGEIGLVKIGGMFIVILIVEVWVQVCEKIGFVLFVDVGWVWEEEVFLGDSGWQVGVGVGICYKMFIGLLCFDIVMFVGGGDGDSGGIQVYIGLGQVF